MKLIIDISENDYLVYCLQFDNGVLEDTIPSHRAKIAIANGQILTKGETTPCEFCQWHKVGEDTYCLECNARPIEEGAEDEQNTSN